MAYALRPTPYALNPKTRNLKTRIPKLETLKP
jgi:hypothetical protein